MTKDRPEGVRVDHHNDHNDHDDAASHTSDTSHNFDLFAEPPDYYPPSPPPTTEQHALGRSGVQLTLHLVGHSVLEAHRLWNGSRVLADYLEEREAQGDHVVRDKTVLELGAGAGLPGIVCGLVLGARKVVVTDYPDPDLVQTMRRNIEEAEAGAAAAASASGQLAGYVPGTVIADGYVWGGDPAPMLAHLRSATSGDDGDEASGAGKASASEAQKRAQKGAQNEDLKYDILLLADLLFRHAEHSKLAYSVAQTLRNAPDSRAYVFFTSYRPWLRHKDLAFFEHARDAGLVVEHVLERRLEKPPLFFENDPGDVSVRSTVSGYLLRWPQPDKTEDPAAFWPPGGMPVEPAQEPPAAGDA
ncbi:hypothetical protein HMPREF1624_04260 [Sporothrix schenckii ATCC 58251]|uniref:Elongation factor methyltransferase 7 n=1 Tax=Sporothrix schenckii (strain ATCC 58251 / de Perez 2211183) TaxID=1391915 RepID=U7PX79_SPOS1|nr:hypothetical protein HMPREF1624_04260 [Sporothrix schenckii ATCC 58251]